MLMARCLASDAIGGKNWRKQGLMERREVIGSHALLRDVRTSDPF